VIDPTGAPAITGLDTTTIEINTSPRRSPNFATPNPAEGSVERFSDFASKFSLATREDQQALLSQGISDLNVLLIGLNRAQIAAFEFQISRAEAILAQALKVAAFPDGPRITIASTKLESDGPTDAGKLVFRVDLTRSVYRVIVGSGQTMQAAIAFNFDLGLLENQIEGAVLPQQEFAPGDAVSFGITTSVIFDHAAEQSIPLHFFEARDAASLSTLPYSENVQARIRSALSSGYSVVIPSDYVQVQGQPKVGWYQVDQTTGETVGVLEDGSHGALTEWVFTQQQGTSNSSGPTARFMLGYILGAFTGNYKVIIFKFVAQAFLNAINDPITNNIALAKNYFLALIKKFDETTELFLRSDAAFRYGYYVGSAVMFQFTADPPLPPALIDVQTFTQTNVIAGSIDVLPAFPVSRAIQGTVNVHNVSVSGELALKWESTQLTNIEIESLSVGQGQVFDSSGNALGTGQVTAAMRTKTAASISGSANLSLQGVGSVDSYGPAIHGLGVSANWDEYAATAMGNLSVKLSTDSLLLDGVLLAAGFYTISTSSLAFSGRGTTSSSSFAGSAALTVANGTLQLGVGSGNLSYNDISLEPANGTKLTGYSGSVTITAGSVGKNTDRVSLSGIAENIVRISAPNGLAVDQNTSVTFQISVSSSLGDIYTIRAEAPDGWNVTIDIDGNITATPAPGT
ncbi:MAG: hypothetical protein ABI557_16725, partial [Aureliella sp.]